METVVKKDIVSIVAKNTNMNRDKVAVIVDGVFKTLSEYLKEANPEVRIEIRGFGVLGIKKAKAKPKSRNPRTNEIIYVPPHRKTFFKPGRILNYSLRNSH